MNKLLISFFLFFLLSCSPLKKDFSKKISNNIDILSDTPGLGKIIQDHYKVTVHYKGMFEDGTEFDSSYKRNKPFVFQFGLRQVIEGWEIGLKDMKVGGIRKIKIPPNLAYGKKGVKNLIPPNSFLIFDIEVLKIEPHKYMKISNDVLFGFKNEKILNFANENLFLIDIRNKEKIIPTGIIEDSFLIEAFDRKGNLNLDFIKKINLVIKKNDHVVLISDKGDISAILANGLVEKLGMSNVYTLKGGIKGWVKKGYPVVK